MSSTTMALFLVTWLSILLMAFQSHINNRPHVHEDTIRQNQKVCIEGGGYFPQGMAVPSPFLVCGVIDGFDQEQDDALAPGTDSVHFLY